MSTWVSIQIYIGIEAATLPNIWWPDTLLPPGEAMHYEARYCGDFLHVIVPGSVGLTTDLGELYDLVREHIAHRQTRFALQFTPDSFLYSQHIAVLIKCVERIREAGGTLAVVRPSNDVAEMLTVVDPEGFVRRVGSLQDLHPVLTPA